MTKEKIVEVRKIRKIYAQERESWDSKEDKGGLLRQRLGELRWRVIQSPEDEAGQQCVLKRRFYYYSGIVRPTVEETTVTGRIVCYDLKRREHSTPSRAGGSTGVRT